MSETTNALALIDVAAGTHRLADPLQPQLRVDDLAPHRGDGIFETVLVTRAGDGLRVHARRPHLNRFRQSADMLDLPAPAPEVFDAAVDAVASRFARDNPGVDEFTVRYAMSRGVDEPLGWALTIPVDTKYERQRREGIRVLSADRGYDAYFGQVAPWQLVGAKTLSYATNMAAGRWAAANGADDVLYVSHDGIALEGPSSNLLVRRGQQLMTPDPKAGLLHGTTQQTIFSRASQSGMLCSYEDLALADVASADAAWLVSSARMAVPIVSLDGTAVPIDEEFTAQLHSWVRDGD